MLQIAWSLYLPLNLLIFLVLRLFTKRLIWFYPFQNGCLSYCLDTIAQSPLFSCCSIRRHNRVKGQTTKYSHKRKNSVSELMECHLFSLFAGFDIYYQHLQNKLSWKDKV